jgi:lysophospholipase L1-like esterase
MKPMKKRNASPRHLPALALAVNPLFLGTLTLGPGSSPPVLAQSAAKIMAPLPANAPYAAEINAFGEADRKQMPPVGAVVFIGSSSIRFWSTLAQDFPEIPVINRGFGGSLIQDSTLYADRIAIPYKPKIIVLCAGTNDLAYGNKTPQQVSQDYQAFVAKIHAALPDTRIVYLAINPTVARWKQEPRNLETNYLIEKFSVQTNSPTEKLSFIDPHAQLLTADDQPQSKLLRADGLHFNAEGYKVWASFVKPRVLALVALDGVRRLNAPKTTPKPQGMP